MTNAVFSPIDHAAEMRAGGFWTDQSFDFFLSAAVKANPEKPAIVADRGGKLQRISFSELEDRTARAAAGLRKLGVVQGDVVAIQSPNWWEFVVTILACSRIGAVMNPLMPIFREHELTFMLGFAEARVFIVPKSFAKHDFETMANTLKESLPKLDHVIVMGGDGPDSFDALLQSSEDRLGPDVLTGKDIPSPDELSVLMYTSGTTGSPKGVMQCANTLVCCANNISTRGGLTSDDVIHVGAPVGHMIGVASGVLLAIRLGSTMVLQEMWNATHAIELMRSEGITFTAGPTPYLADLLETAATSGIKPDNLNLFLCAGAPIPPTLITRAADELGLKVTSVWGMTETLASTMTEPERALEKSSTTDGRALDGIEVKVVDDDGDVVANGENGRLMVRGAQSHLGYYKRGDIATFDAEGWMDTGDIAYLDDEGYIRIAGRTKDIIIRGGENVPVADIENVMYEHPAVLAVALVGFPDERLGERACAFVQLRPGESMDLVSLQAYMAEKKITKQFWPERVEILDALPRTPSGKIKKFELSDVAKDFGA